MKKIQCLLLIIVFLMTVIGLSGCGKSTAPEPAKTSAPATAITMKLGHFANATHPGNLAAKQFAANVERTAACTPIILIKPKLMIILIIAAIVVVTDIFLALLTAT